MIQEEFNSQIKDKCSSKFFIIDMEQYNNIIDKFYCISNKGDCLIEFPKVNEFNILSITTAASLFATDDYIKANCDNIYNQFTRNLSRSKFSEEI